MERVKISICGRDFNLRVENPERFKQIAKELQEDINRMQSNIETMSITDVITLTALDIAEGADKIKSTFNENMKKLAEVTVELNFTKENLAAVNREKDVLTKDISVINMECKELKQKIIELSDELKTTATLDTEKENSNEISLLKAEKDSLETQLFESMEENEKLLVKIKELEQEKEQYIAQKAQLEAEQIKIADEQESVNSEETEQLKNTISVYEQSFLEYQTERNKEVEELNEEIHQLKKKCADLNNQLNEILDDGQMTL